MANPPIKDKLESKLFTNNPPAVQRKLDDCLAVDPLHIAPGQSGDHVARIQQALDTLRKGGLPIPEIKDASGRYQGTAADNPPPQPGTTAAAVLEYKKLRGIRVAGRPFDAIVGRRTITQLDNDLAVRDPKPQPEPPLAPAELPILDVIVRYQGVLDEPRQMAESEVFPITPLINVGYPPSGRSLFRVGRFTTKIREEFAGALDADVSAIENKLKDKTPGLIFVVGTSSGGRNAIDMAIKLSQKNLQLRLVAPIDPAFFPSEALNSPSNRFGRPDPTPRFGVSGNINAGPQNKKNFFQQVGNHAELSVTQRRLLYSSGMANKEVHGTIDGFVSVDRSDVVRSGSSDDEAHGQLIGFALSAVVLEITSILAKTTTPPPLVPPPVFVPAFQQ